MLQAWLLSIRFKPLLVGIGPCVLGMALASSIHFSWLVSAVCLFCMLCLQTALHFFNDAFDFLKGADKEDRKGPKRAVQRGLITPELLIKAGFFVLFFSGLGGLYLIFKGGWPIFFIGAVSLTLTYFYTGGRYCLAYLGVADPFVILFFGIIPVATVFYLNTGYWSEASLIGGGICGGLSLGLLLVNNLRDEAEDRRAGKRTLVVRWGHKFGFIEWAIAHYLPYFLLSYWFFTQGELLLFIPLILLPLSFYLHFYLYKADKNYFLYKSILGLTCLHYLLFISIISFLFSMVL